MTAPRTGHLDILLPRAIDPTVLDAVLRLHVETRLCGGGEWPARIEHGDSVPDSPGVVRWPVTYLTGARG